MNWWNEVHGELGWFDEPRQMNILDSDICGSCSELSESCSCCNASISGKCLAVTHNEPFCHPECDKMERSNENGGV